MLSLIFIIIIIIIIYRGFKNYVSKLRFHFCIITIIHLYNIEILEKQFFFIKYLIFIYIVTCNLATAVTYYYIIITIIIKK
jgi:hypothetical protein